MVRTFMAALAATTCIAAVATPAAAQTREYNIPAGSLKDALDAYVRQSGRQVVYRADQVRTARSPGVRGSFVPEAALAALLAGSGFTTRSDGDLVAIVRTAVEPATDSTAVSASATAGSPSNEIIVVGTQIRGAAPVGAPITIMDREFIESTGRGTLQSLFEAIPANFGGGPNEAVTNTTARNNAGRNSLFGSSINLRGLGANSTLVLFDNVRMASAGAGAFVDISLVPMLAVDRVEFLTDGASAIYGADAVGGVVNIKFRKPFNGAESFARVGTADGASQEYQLGQVVGHRWGSGGLVLAYQYSARTPLRGSSRPFATEDLRPFGGPDVRTRFTAPGNIIAADGRVFGIPAGQDGRSLLAQQLLPDVPNRRDARDGFDLLPEQRSHAIFANLNQDLSANTRLFARGLYARRNLHILRPIDSIGNIVVVPTSNPFYVDPIGTRQPLRVEYDFSADLGPSQTRGRAEGLSASSGLVHSFGDWQVELAGSYALQKERLRSFNVPNRARLTTALADSDPSTAYNVFGGGGGTNPATIALIRGSSTGRGSYEVWSGALRADGPLLRTPMGLIRVAAGIEHRQENAKDIRVQDISRAQPVTITLPGLPAKRDVDAIYAELLMPISGGDAAWLPGAIDLSVAGRKEWYSDFGQTFNPKFGIAWRPLAGLTVRSSYGRSFRAPIFPEMVGDENNFIGAFQLPDPRSPSGQTAVIGEFGFSNNIGPETAWSWTVGADLSDWPIAGLRASATWFDISYRGRIASASAEFMTFLSRRDLYGALVQEPADQRRVTQLFADPRFSNPSGLQPAEIGAIVNGLIQNLSSQQVRGLDFDINYRLPLVGGTASVGAAGTRLFAIEQQVTATSPPVNVVGTLGNPVRLRVRGQAGWERDGFSFIAFVQHVGSYRNQTVTPAARVASWTTVDATVAYRFADSSPLQGGRIALSGINLFDRDPPYVEYRNFDTTLAYDPEQASPLGRTLALQMSFSW